MLKPNEIEKVSMALDEPMKSLENQIMSDIVRRIKINGEITRSADWQINRLHELGMSKRDIKKAIADNLNLGKAEINHLYRDVIRKGYSHDEELYRYKGKPQIPFDKNEELQQLLSAVAVQTSGDIKNISQSLGFAIRQPDGNMKFAEVGEYYQSTLDNAITGIATGAFDYNTVIKRTISEMTNSGLRTVDYASGWSNRVDVAARRSIMTGLSQLTAKVNEQNAEELETDKFEVSWHSGARPSHQEWQGKVYTYAQLERICGLGTVQGLCGANCYHDYYPFIEGISERTYTDEQLAEMKAEENKPREYAGKQYTKYEALQRQRKLETTMRAQRQQIKLLEEGGADEDDIINARCRYHGTSQDYTAFSNAMDLPQQRARVTADGLGNVNVKSVDKGNVSGGRIVDETVDKSSKSDIIKTEGVRNMTISSIERPIEMPIEQRHTGKGNPNAVVTFGVELNNRQKKLLEKLADFDSRIIIEKSSVNMADLSALTANTGHEFAMFTKGEERLIIRGNEYKVEVDIKAAKELSSQGYKWSGHTHPGSDFLCMQPSDGDYAVLDCFKQSNAVIYNSKGNFRTFEKRE